MGEIKIKVALFTREISNVLGGMERQLLDLASNLAGAHFDVTVISLDQGAALPFYDGFHSEIKFVQVPGADPSQKSKFRQRIARQIALLKILQDLKPDIGIGFMIGGFLYSRIPMFMVRKPLMLAERNSPDIYKLTSVKKYRYLIYLIMSLSGGITVQFPRFRGKYPKFLQNKIVAIPNFIQTNVPASKNRFSNKEEITYLFAGRLSYQKQVLLLVEAFIFFAREEKHSVMLIYGEGHLLNMAQATVTEANLNNRIKFYPPSKDIFSIINTVDVLCIPSIWEGFPNIVTESLSAGVPVLGFSNCDGVSDLVIDNFNGWLEKDDTSIYPLVRLFQRSRNDLQQLKEFKSNCISSVNSFDNRSTTKAWVSLLLEKAGKNGSQA